MNPNEVVRIVESLHREKSIDPEVVFKAIEVAMLSAAKRQYGEEAEIDVTIDRESGEISGVCNGEQLDADLIGRIGAQTAKQVIIQKIREAERDALIEEYDDQIGHMVSGVVQRNEGGASTVSIGNVEALLPRSEQIPGESHHPNERLRAIISDVRAHGNRVKVILSRTHLNLVRRLFEQEIPEISDEVISINQLAREPGYRSKVAVSSSDSRIDCVGACVGVRGNRIKNIVDELAGERIDIVRWSDDPQELIPNALQPAQVNQVLLCDMIGRAIVLVHEDQLSLAIGRRGQNVRLASKLCGWDIEIMTEDELNEQIERAVAGFSDLDGMTGELAEQLVEQGYLSYDDLSVIEPDALMEMGGLTDEEADHIVTQAEERAEIAEKQAAELRRQKPQQQQQLQQQEAAAAAAAAADPSSNGNDGESAEAVAEATETDSAEATDDSGTAEVNESVESTQTDSAEATDDSDVAEVNESVEATQTSDSEEAPSDGDEVAEASGGETSSDS